MINMVLGLNGGRRVFPFWEHANQEIGVLDGRWEMRGQKRVRQGEQRLDSPASMATALNAGWMATRAALQVTGRTVPKTAERQSDCRRTMACPNSGCVAVRPFAFVLSLSILVFLVELRHEIVSAEVSRHASDFCECVRAAGFRISVCGYPVGLNAGHHFVPATLHCLC